jgi:hypothetical protein
MQKGRLTGASAAAHPTRRGADGKGPRKLGTSPAAYPTAYALGEEA